MTAIDAFDVESMTREIIAFEALRTNVYDDATARPIGPDSYVHGHPTIGIGRALDGAKGISVAEAVYLWTNDLAEYRSQLSPLSWFSGLDEVRQRVILSMRHQLGFAGLMEFTGMIAAIRRQDWDAAAGCMLASLWARQTARRAFLLSRVMQSGIPLETVADGHGGWSLRA